MLNREVVTDSESDDPDAYLNSTVISESNIVIRKKVDAIRCQMRRQQAKYIERQNFLRKRKLKVLKSIPKKYPDIGKKLRSL